MRILSQFHDYYDRAMGYGADPTVTFVRDQFPHGDPEPLGDRFPRLAKAVRTMPRHPWLCETLLILFCGQAYPAWRVPGQGDTFEDEVFYSIEEWRAAITKERLRAAYCPERNLDRFFQTYHSHPPTAQYEKQWKVNNQAALATADEAHRHFEAPILMLDQRWREVRIWKNPALGPLGFPRMVDAFTAFQEIAQYIGGGPLAGTKDAPADIADDVMRDSKGFDDRSFRMDPPGKKENRRRNKARKRSK